MEARRSREEVEGIGELKTPQIIDKLQQAGGRVFSLDLSFKGEIFFEERILSLPYYDLYHFYFTLYISMSTYH